eukprot:CAMPEP_0194222740 /NCGR_PEP_ID=MMETSP0156-20130528/33671_1 /TAXON_ID=33649 /ORGANISM="Thalassionema nitzschioides, Strain L26-B" /LENGTH=36 /DNA_ID= /DNA_START= /DNA_END= /DNA_ORIENTATION=
MADALKPIPNHTSAGHVKVMVAFPEDSVDQDEHQDV